MAANHVPVFTPTWEEFKDFAKYVKYIESQGAAKVGAALIRAPDEYQPRRAGYANVDIPIKEPHLQVFTAAGGEKGIYERNVKKAPSMSLKEYRDLCESDKYRTPPHASHDELQKVFWDTIDNGVSPIYGANIAGSVTDPDCDVWNVYNLDSILLKDSKVRFEAIHTSWLYFGMWKTIFPWHVEDWDLYSINYIHYGAPKTWYVVSHEHHEKLRKLVDELVAKDAEPCDNFLSHRKTMLSPAVLEAHGIPYSTILHPERHFVITFPNAAHAGFNHGFNCAESSNFATEGWVDFAMKTKYCTCGKYTFMTEFPLDIDTFVNKYRGGQQTA